MSIACLVGDNLGKGYTSNSYTESIAQSTKRNVSFFILHIPLCRRHSTIIFHLKVIGRIEPDKPTAGNESSTGQRKMTPGSFYPFIHSFIHSLFGEHATDT